MRPRLLAFLRTLLACLALLAAATPAAAAVGEGVLAASAGKAAISVHVEDSRQAQCPFVHPEDCALCAALHVAALPSIGFTLAWSCVGVVAAPTAAAAAELRAVTRSTRPARAPPMP